ncbi:LysR family transcriptional regulator [Kiloniella antarctica]|uniref:LysR family transcriptional regulator n=1 Tax=Kiloniella antarctica TaxID=1550907 RepID=A0ABW5BK07_9PROT
MTITSSKNVQRLELKQLRILKALLCERNVSRVANSVGLTQQAVSDQLRKMREIFEDPLFVRTSNGLIPTPTAEQLGERLEKILSEVEGLFDEAEFDLATIDKVFTIAATDYAQLVILPHLLPKIWRDAPNLKINLEDFDIDNLHNEMVTGKVDLALAFPSFVSESYPRISLFKEHHICVASKESHLAGHQLSLVDIAAIPQIIVSQSRPDFRGSIDTLFEEQGMKRNVIMSAPCFSVVPHYIKNSDAIAFIPSRSMPKDGLIELNLEENTLEFEVIAAWHSRSNHDPLHNWVLSLLKEEFSRN